jgi:hypothetical protein
MARAATPSAPLGQPSEQRPGHAGDGRRRARLEVRRRELGLPFVLTSGGSELIVLQGAPRFAFGANPNR